MILHLKRFLLEKFGVDGAIGYTVLSRIIQASGGLVTLIFIALFLSVHEQGYYYTFGSIIAIQIFFELGLNSIITQYVAHEKAHLKWQTNIELVGSDQHLSRLSSLLHFCIKTYGYLAIILFLALEVTGLVFFTKYNINNADVLWQSQWMLVAFTTSLVFIVNPILAFIEGLGKVKEVAQIRLFQQMAYISTIALVFILGGKLWALGIGSLISFIVLFSGILFSYRRKLLLFIYHATGKWKVNYLKEIYPYQWKIALSWISGYFIFQLFNPVLFATEGAITAGQMGMTLAALNGISSLSMSWITTKIPLFSSLIAVKKYNTLDSVFNTTIKQLTSINFFLIIVFITLIYILNYFEFAIATRFLNISPIVLLCLVTFFNQLIFSWATYLRCHKKEPFLINSIVGGLLSAISTIILGKFYGLQGIVYGYTFISLAIGLPWAYGIFKKKRKSWH